MYIVLARMAKESLFLDTWIDVVVKHRNSSTPYNWVYPKEIPAAVTAMGFSFYLLK